LTKELVELMKGEMSVESEFGDGTEFTVKLPIKFIEDFEVLEQGEPLMNNENQIIPVETLQIKTLQIKTLQCNVSSDN